MSSAREELRQHFEQHIGTMPPARAIELACRVSECTGIPQSLIRGRTRSKRIAAARLVWYWLLRQEPYTLEAIGECIGRDFSTISLCSRKVEERPDLLRIAQTIREMK